jgi:aryl-alcohol dehydrogenase-like predicted oxidoreductase
MSTPPSAAAAGALTIGGDLKVRRLGFGAMRLTGPGIWGEPQDRAGALKTLRLLPQLGVDFIDTADSYGPSVSEDLIAEALHPYDGLVIATKGGLVRLGPNIWRPVGRPDYLRQCVLMSLRRLRLDQIPLWQLHRIDPHVPRDEQFGVIAEMIRHAGLSEVGVEEIEAARKVFPVASVQNRFNLVDRASAPVLEYCAGEGLAFIPWFPLAAGDLARPGGPVARLADRANATAGQIALAWTLRVSPATLPIPGTCNPAHLEENVAAAAVELSEEDMKILNAAPPATG